ncbi:MAG TPA: hypothetical protein VGM17_00520, partial [Rhizomicrobium sp.]
EAGPSHFFKVLFLLDVADQLFQFLWTVEKRLSSIEDMNFEWLTALGFSFHRIEAPADNIVEYVLKFLTPFLAKALKAHCVVARKGCGRSH